MGILAGDIACAFSNELIANSNFKPEYIIKALRELNKTYAIEGYGQAMDIFAGIENNITEKDVLHIHRLKTVPYTFDCPVKIGAILAGCNEKALNNLSTYTVPLGTAFQIQDDILGMFGSEEKLGKPVISDLKEGKKTLLIINALSKASQKQKEIINYNLGNKKTTISNLQEVQKVIVETKALIKSKNMATNLVQKAIQALHKMPLEEEGKEFLMGIARYMIEREF
jgi:geranylgeranyl diphosphate synthase type I